MELLVCDYRARAPVLVVQDAVGERTEEVAVGCLGRSKLDVIKRER